MAFTHDKIVHDYQRLLSGQILLLGMLENSPCKPTRIQKLSLFIERILEVDPAIAHGSYIYGGFSDELYEASVLLSKTGAIVEGKDGYELSDYGKALLAEAKKDPENKDLLEEMPSVVAFLDSLPDDDLLRLSYILYPDTTDKSLIKSEINVSKKSYSIIDVRVRTGLSREQLKEMILRKISDLDSIIDMLDDGRSVVVSSEGMPTTLLTKQGGRYILTEKYRKFF
ncbi:MAG: hypothetical protein E7Z62_01570 [Thermoplasmata archaeon]|nr:hypothetical protein [Thermoplasmata archaeon]